MQSRSCKASWIREQEHCSSTLWPFVRLTEKWYRVPLSLDVVHTEGETTPVLINQARCPGEISSPRQHCPNGGPVDPMHRVLVQAGRLTHAQEPFLAENVSTPCSSAFWG